MDFTTGGVIKELAEDARRLAQLRSLGLEELTHEMAVAESSSARGTDDILRFMQYFKGLAAHGRRSSRAAAFLNIEASRHAPSRPRPRALIFSCSYGDGHKSASQAISSYLATDHINSTIVDTTSDPRFKVGLVHSLGIDVKSVYNSLILGRQWYRMENLVDSFYLMLMGQYVSRCPAPTCNTRQKDAIRAVLLEERPDLVITVYHMDLLPILEVAKDLGDLPVLHIATDMDLKMREVFGRIGPAPTYPRFLVGAPFNADTSLSTLAPMSNQSSFLAGYPVRDAFLRAPVAAFTEQQRAALVPSGAKVILVMTGGGGQDVPWPEQLAKDGLGLGVRVHIMVIAGRRRSFAKRLERALPHYATFPGGRRILQGASKDVTVEVMRSPHRRGQERDEPFYLSAESLSTLMDIADAVITKPGGGTTAELAYRGTPAVFDATPGLLHWEEFTVQVFEEAGRGIRFSTADELPQALHRAMASGRSIKLAEDPDQPGSTLDTGSRFRASVGQLLEKPCPGSCSLFPAQQLAVSS